MPPAVSADEPPLPFVDIKESHWAYNSVKRLYSMGLLSGISENEFGTGHVMTRAMFATMIAKVVDADTSEVTENHFFDVADGRYYTAPINWAYENGLISGDGNGIFMPDRPITREQVAVLLRTLGDYQNHDVTYEDPKLLSLYHDNGSISNYARSAMAWAVDFGLMSGNEDYALQPRKTATRAEIAVMFAKFLDYADLPPIVPPVIFKVTFKNWNGDVLYTSNVASGENAKYRGETPQHAKDRSYTYTFTGWDKPLDNITADTVFTAQYKKADIYYKLSFKNWDGTVLASSTVKAGTTASYNGPTPTKPSDAKYKYTFKGWDKMLVPIFTDTIYTAQFEQSEIPPHERDIRNDVFFAGRFSYNGTEFRMSSDLANRIYNKVANSEGRTTGVYVVDLQTHATFGFNANVNFPTASTVKSGMALTAYKMAEAGKFSLNDIWTYYYDLHYCVRTGRIKDSADGTKYKARDVIYEMVHESDNAAYYMTQYYVGYKNYNAVMSSIGVKNMHTHYQHWGYYTPQELALIMQESYNYRNQSSYGAELFNLFLNAKYNFIKNGLKRRYGSSIQIAHKSGFNDWAYSDVGVVFGNRPYIMAIMTKPGNLEDREEYVRSLALLLDEYMIEYSNYLKTHTN